ncbi:MAG TPA: hypothetical protein VGM88_08110 [Kofleriaceae bacterium]|jgi:hypothetical protein
MKLAVVGMVLVASSGLAHAGLAGHTETDVELPFDGGFGDQHSDIGVGGINLAIGQHLTDPLYLGGVAEDELLIENSSIGDGWTGTRNRMRLGGELRWYFATGTGAARVNCGPAESVPVHYSLGLRAGAQAFSTAHLGQFAEVTVAADWQLNHTIFGFYLAAGMNHEPAAEFANQTTSDDGIRSAILPAAVTELDFTAGFRIGFGD